MKIVFFDDQCLVCNRTVRLLIKLDKHDQLRYASLHSSASAQYLEQVTLEDIDSIIYYNNGEIFIYSMAVIEILKDLGFKVAFLKWIPTFIRDNIYQIVARNRYRLNNMSCPILTEQMKGKMLD